MFWLCQWLSQSVMKQSFGNHPGVLQSLWNTSNRSCHVMSCHVMSCHFMSCHEIFSVMNFFSWNFFSSWNFFHRRLWLACSLARPKSYLQSFTDYSSCIFTGISRYCFVHIHKYIMKLFILWPIVHAMNNLWTISNLWSIDHRLWTTFSYMVNWPYEQLTIWTIQLFIDFSYGQLAIWSIDRVWKT